MVTFPDPSEVLLGIDRGDGVLGTLTLPAASDVRYGIDRGDGVTGTLGGATDTVSVMPSANIKDFLAAAGLGTFAATSGWGIYVSKAPVSPDTVITIYDVGGFDPDPKFRFDEVTVNVQVRGAAGEYSEAWTKAQAVKDALLGLPGQDKNGVDYVGIWMRGDLGFSGYDDLDRPMFSMNFLVRRVPASGTYRTNI